MFTPSPQIAQDADHLAEDSDEEDPGDGELDIGYTEAGTSSNSACRAEQDYEDDNEFEEIPAAVIHEFPAENVPNFPQEVKLSGFRAQKATLEELFAVIST
ncbi:hypothetical protein JG688_00017310 [Phytophthora aleatoria]|uniref:Uncharacterized protein n=1 Tax=Phytophthora aleatoria TaxID=2496075 RepID=A0A8J5ISS1_9STRA|nr:hypothetical protein JG688_00017310 [Phytophthora aleatoria]